MTFPNSLDDAFGNLKEGSEELKERCDNLDKAFAEGNIAEKVKTLQNDFVWTVVICLFFEDCKKQKSPRAHALSFIKIWEDRIKTAWKERDEKIDSMAGGFLLKMLSDSVQSSKSEEEALKLIISELRKIANKLPEEKEDTENKEEC